MRKDLRAKLTVRQAITPPRDTYTLSREDACQLVRTACDVRITQLIDGTLGVHIMIPKSLFTRTPTTRNPNP